MKNRVIAIQESLEKAIENGYIKLNEHIRLDAVTQLMDGDLNEAERQEEKDEEIASMLYTAQKYFPQEAKELISKLQQSK